jgi:hypothetical protein
MVRKDGHGIFPNADKTVVKPETEQWGSDLPTHKSFRAFLNGN